MPNEVTLPAVKTAELVSKLMPHGAPVAVIATGGFGRETMRSALTLHGFKAATFDRFDESELAPFDAFLVGQVDFGAASAARYLSLDERDIIELKPGEFLFFSRRHGLVDLPLHGRLKERLKEARQRLAKTALVAATAIFTVWNLHAHMPNPAWTLAGVVVVTVLAWVGFRWASE